MKARYYPDDHSPGSPHHRFPTINTIKLALVLNPAILSTPLFCRYFCPKCETFNCKEFKRRIIVMQPCCGFWEEETMYVVPRLKMLRWIFLLFYFFKFAYCCYTFIYGKICLYRETGITFIRHPLHLVIMRRL